MNYKIKQIATCGCEILNNKNEIIAWSINKIWAEKIKSALEKDEKEGK